MATVVAPILSLTADRWIRLGAVVMMLVVATSAAILSWSGLTFLAVMSGIPSEIAWLLAVAIDGSLILGSIETVHATLTKRSPAYGWTLTGVGVSLSIYGNVVSSADSGFQSALVHAIAPCVLFLSVEGLVRILKFRITQTQEALDEAQRKADIEERRRLKAEERVSTPRTGKAVVPRRGGKASADDAEVSDYKAVMGNLPEGSSKVARIEAVLSAYPEARNVHIALAIGMDQKAISTAIVRVKERMKREAGEVSEGAKFQEIVKDFVPAEQ